MPCHGRPGQQGQGQRQGRLVQLALGAAPCSPGVTTLGHLPLEQQAMSEVAMLRSRHLRSDHNIVSRTNRYKLTLK